MRKQRPKVFLDTSALIAGIASSGGAARAVLQLAEIGLIEVIVSRQVIVEADRNIEEKLPEMLNEYRGFIELLAVSAATPL
jgi:predicted nucleic acid-binding protein